MLENIISNLVALSLGIGVLPSRDHLDFDINVIGQLEYLWFVLNLFMALSFFWIRQRTEKQKVSSWSARKI